MYVCVCVCIYDRLQFLYVFLTQHARFFVRYKLESMNTNGMCRTDIICDIPVINQLMYVCMYVCMYAVCCVCMCVLICVYVCVCICMCVCVRIRVCMYVFM